MATIAFVGDLSLGGLKGQALQLPDGHIDATVSDLLGRADHVVANLECVLSDQWTQQDLARRPLALVAPTSSVGSLSKLGVRAVCLANNHTLDLSHRGALDTLRALDGAGIIHFGLGANYEAAFQPAVLVAGSMRIALLGFVCSGYPKRDRPGSFELDSPEARRMIRAARSDCDFVVVVFHDGIEATSYPMKATMQTCHKVADWGADLIVGSHPHTVQGIERYGRTPIAYSLGNFVLPMTSDAHYAQWKPQTCLARLGVDFEISLIEKGMILMARFEPGQPVQVEPVPLHIAKSGLPEWPADMAAEQAFIQQISGAFSRPDDPVWAQRDRIEAGYWSLLRRSVDWKQAIRRPYAIRWRHVKAVVNRFLR